MKALVSDLAQRLKQTEEALRESEERYRTLAESSPDAIFIIDRDIVVRYVNSEAAALWRRRPEDLVGRRQSELFPPDEARRHAEVLNRVLNTGESVREDQLIPYPAGDRWHEVRLVPLRDEHRNIIGVMGAVRDITERVRMERQILEISDREQARIGQDLHDGLCQQLVSLTFDANSLERDLSAQGRPEAKTARRLARYLDEAITVARQLSRGLFPARLVSEGLSAALEELARAARERFNLECRFESKGTVSVPDEAVATHLYRIAQEAVNNAVKHAQAARILIGLQTRAGQVELTVEDDGVGIAPESSARGTGLGLRIMDYRARAIGATLQVSPGTSGGTAVCCCLPSRRG